MLRLHMCYIVTCDFRTSLKLMPGAEQTVFFVSKFQSEVGLYDEAL